MRPTNTKRGMIDATILLKNMTSLMALVHQRRGKCRSQSGGGNCLDGTIQLKEGKKKGEKLGSKREKEITTTDDNNWEKGKGMFRV
ncbi:hypothetical protein QJS04_geneDACA013951 [Acorus gramineus]|uniref:Uncharacterized protein n=1 Tax=Acorus gramineus TaxID=55184 RepID=A0AAV9AWF4_ACOGR|nr:hypothetical protein QJS04_geneDACA013951 [Acorus gramineus]